MQKLSFDADELVSLLNLSEHENVCLLDSCGVGNLGSHLLIAGIEPVETLKASSDDPNETLQLLNEKIESQNLAAIFTISYDFGLKLERISARQKEHPSAIEPDIFISLFDCLIIHNYDTSETFVTGDESQFKRIIEKLERSRGGGKRVNSASNAARVSSNFSKAEYLLAIERIKEHIRDGDTYQTNLTQRLQVELPLGATGANIFYRLRKDHPAPFSAFIQRPDSTVVSASPERFFKLEDRIISASPIKGTRPRGKNEAADERLRKELLASEKDRAENTMIVDLLRNDLGRICEFGSVRVETLCDLEQHPTLFHLVSTITGRLRQKVAFPEILKAVFPCGSITGAPKIRTIQIIDQLETAARGLSMGAIGYRIPDGRFGMAGKLDLSVAIRTAMIRNRQAVFNVGGGIVIDSDPEKEYEESLLKAKALLAAMGTSSEFKL